MSQQQKEKELLARISDLESEIKKLKERKKYGLVWEEKPEEVVSQCQENIPIIKEIKNRKINTSENNTDNILIEGDNYHSLSVLNYTHQGKIDVIYIDPPYNTGSKDFKYNDNFVDAEDSFRHSKWLSFIEKRLKLAHFLLKDNGVIFISIDDNEQAPLRMLCNDIFGEDNFIANIPRRTKAAGKTTDVFSLNHDYILVFAKNRSLVKLKAIPIDDRAYKYKDEYCSERGPYALSQTLDYDSLSYSSSLDYELKIDGRSYFPGGNKKAFLDRKSGKHRASDWTWRWSKELVEFGNKNGFIVIKKGKDGNPRIYTKTYFKAVIEKNNNSYEVVFIDRTKNLSTLDLIESIYSNDMAKKDIRAIFGASADFAYPKPVELIKYLINTIYSSVNSTVLDFFAGSGTTGHAVLDLNKEDGGNRRFILCTNNEHNICEEVTYERLKRVMRGCKNNGGEKTDGLGGNLSYYKTDLVNIEKLHKISDEAKIKVTYQVGEMIALREDTLNEIEKNDWWQIFEGGNKMTAIYFKEDKSKLQDLVQKLRKNGGNSVLYIFSWGKNEYKNEFLDLRVEDIPEPILEVYKEINRL